jgi:excisionase family DNA binding protein
MTNRLLNVQQAATRLGLKEKTIRQWIALRKIQYIKAGAAVRIEQSEINRIIRSGTKPRQGFASIFAKPHEVKNEEA